jgi:hypothetical protein
MGQREETPRARMDGLVVKALNDEVLVYDLTRHRAHSLNRAAAAVWRRLDGRTTVRELAARLSEELGSPADEQIVWLALKELDRAHLLDAPLRAPAGQGLSRRQWLGRVGVAAGVSAMLVPTVSSIVAPHAYAQASPVGCSPPDSCATFTCAGGCACVPTTEGTTVCAVPSCVAACTTTADCPPGTVCFTLGCCGPATFCVPIAPAGTTCATQTLKDPRRWR